MLHFSYIISFFFHIEAIIVDSANDSSTKGSSLDEFLDPVMCLCARVCVCIFMHIFTCVLSTLCVQTVCPAVVNIFPPLGFPVREQGWYNVLMSISLPKLTLALFAFNYSLFRTLQITQHVLQLVKFKYVDSVLYFFLLVLYDVMRT